MRTAWMGAAIGWLLSALLLLPLGTGCSREGGRASSGARWERKESWSQLRPGMTTDQVRGILGEPTREESDVAFTYWRYGEGQDAGRVTFVSGKVKDWTSAR